MRAEGVVLHLSGNSPLLLTRLDVLWVVETGQVDVFSVRMVSGEPSGPRSFLFNVRSGASLVGIDPEATDGLGLIAVGIAGTTIREIPADALRGIAGDDENRRAVAMSVENLIGSLVSGEAQSHSAAVRTRLPINATTELEPGEVIGGAQDQTLWVRHDAGSSEFVGNPDFQIDAGTFFPVPAGLWIRARERARLTVFDTASYLKQDPSWNSLAEVRRLIGERMRATLRRAQESERIRLERRLSLDVAARDVSLRSLASLLQAEAPSVAAEDAGEPLLAACRAIGHVSGIEFKPAGRWEKLVDARDQLNEICRASRVRHRRVALRGTWWRTDSGPLLCFRGQAATPLAALPVSPGEYELFDPSGPSRIPLDAAVAATLQPFAVSFYRSFAPRIIRAIDLVRFATAGIHFDVRAIAIASVAAGLIGLALPIAIGYLVQEVIPNANRHELLALFIILIVAAVATTMFDLARSYSLLRVEAKSEASLQSAVIDRLVSLPVPFFRKYAVGNLATRAMSIEKMRQILGGSTMTSFLVGLTAFFNLILLFFYSAKLALIAIAVIVAAVTIISICNYLALRYQRRIQDLTAGLAGLVFQLVGGIAKLRVAGAEDRAFAVWARQFREKRAMVMRAASLQNIVKTLNDVLPVASSTVVFFAVSSMAATSPMSVADFIAFNTAFALFLVSAVSMSGTLLQALAVVPIYEQVKPILTALPESDATKPDSIPLTGSIEVNHLTFRYKEDGPAILQDVSFHAAPGEFIALSGPSGSGKSTTLRLLLGFESAETGAIYYDGQDLSQIDVTSVRRQMGVVLQSSRLTYGDIFTNIVGSSPLTLKDAWEAAEMAGFADDVRSMPMGMHTIISEGGSIISGGQRQRLLIARALVRKPRIILFDEATSALDNRTQRVVTESLDRLNATRIVIAHRLSTIRNAQRIYVMVNGRIEQTGTFHDLNTQAGMFQSLVERQML